MTSAWRSPEEPPLTHAAQTPPRWRVKRKGTGERLAESQRRRAADRDQQSWLNAAACREVDSNLFFPEGTTRAAIEGLERAKAICATCPVRSPCLQFAVTTNQEFGVWGGYDHRERRELRRQWNAGLLSLPLDPRPLADS